MLRLVHVRHWLSLLMQMLNIVTTDFVTIQCAYRVLQHHQWVCTAVEAGAQTVPVQSSDAITSE